MSFWDATRNGAEQLADYFIRALQAVGDKSAELVGKLLDKLTGAEGLQAIGQVPDGQTVPELGVPVESDVWRPWMHLHLAADQLRILDAWFPLREAVGGVVIVVGFMAVAWLTRSAMKLVFGR